MNPQVIWSLAGGTMRKCKSLLCRKKHGKLPVLKKKINNSIAEESSR
jgi:hypothetical protein